MTHREIIDFVGIVGLIKQVFKKNIKIKFFNLYDPRFTYCEQLLDPKYLFSDGLDFTVVVSL